MLRLLDCNLQTFGFAGTFWIGGRITNGTVGSRIHLFQLRAQTGALLRITVWRRGLAAKEHERRQRGEVFACEFTVSPAEIDAIVGFTLLEYKGGDGVHST